MIFVLFVVLWMVDFFHQFLVSLPQWYNSLVERMVQFPLPLLRGEIFLLLLIFLFVVIYYRFKSDKHFFSGF